MSGQQREALVQVAKDARESVLTWIVPVLDDNSARLEDVVAAQVRLLQASQRELSQAKRFESGEQLDALLESKRILGLVPVYCKRLQAIDRRVKRAIDRLMLLETKSRDLEVKTGAKAAEARRKRDEARAQDALLAASSGDRSS